MVSVEQRRPVVVLYERIADAIHAGTYPPGSTLPSEPRLAAELGVSRPALREALLLLQEDGLVTVRRGVGRTVSDRPPRRGFEHVRPLEELLGTAGPVRVRALLRAVEEPTDFTTQHLLAPARARLRFWESLLTADGHAAALSQEWAADEEVLATAHPAFAEALAAGPAPGAAPSMLAVLAAASRGVQLTAHSGITATLVGQRRGEQLGRPADTPAVLVTQVVRVGGTPVLAAKHMLPTGAAPLPVLQSN
ncbi:GntR family transcriptional regulator [Streptomyces lichenis]|uniref:GntR family transcriptional regulator n=1 Tax=Streptomyces lichenis TaxID=2306967 RepID=A0ABT0IDX2_9ACTN|nr:GntR family transcriptional regulator [Streptomyces lichenis]MCK8679533.1 GntR family transcriptional regulator [Streptomyces lichenis]